MKASTRRWLKHNRLNIWDIVGLIIIGLVIGAAAVVGPVI